MKKGYNTETFSTIMKYLIPTMGGVFLVDILLLLFRVSEETRRAYKLVAILIVVVGLYFYLRWKFKKNKSK